MAHLRIAPPRTTIGTSIAETLLWRPRPATCNCPGIAMCFLGLLGVTGLYARQLKETGWLGLGGYLLLSLFYALTMAFQFIEAFVSPRLASESPAFVEGLLGIADGHATGIDLGALPTVYAFTGIIYLLGGLLLGIATFRARILPRWTGIMLAAAVPIAPVAVALLPHAFARYAAVPMGLALACLGYALWSERREHAAAPAVATGSPRLSHVGAE